MDQTQMVQTRVDKTQKSLPSKDIPQLDVVLHNDRRQEDRYPGPSYCRHCFLLVGLVAHRWERQGQG